MLFPFPGSMYDGLADGYGYGTSRGSYYTKTQTGNSSWGYPVRYSFIWELWRVLEVTCAENTFSRSSRGHFRNYLRDDAWVS